MAEDDTERVLAHVRAVLGDPGGWPAPPDHRSVALAVIDSVWGIGVRWTAVRKVLDRYEAARRAESGDPDRDGPAELLAFIEATGGAERFADGVGNRQRTSTNHGILKAEAVRQVAIVLRDAGIDTPADVRSATPERLAELRSAWTAIPGQRSGLSLDAFLMVTGLAGVKADRMVRRFVAEAIGSTEQAVKPARAAELVHGAAARCDADARALDAAIWQYQSTLGRA